MGSVMDELRPKIDEGIEAFRSLPTAVKGIIAAGSVLASGAVCASLFESFLRMRERSRFKPDGQLIRVAKGNVHVIYKKGPRDASSETRPTVILDAGVGCWSLVYKNIIDDIAAVADVVAFDRFGYGFSSYVEKGNRLVDSTDNLIQALQYLDIEGPFIYVAHSLAGAYANYYAGKNTSKIAGMIYIDAANHRSVRLMNKLLPKRKLDSTKPGFSVKVMSRLGILRLLTYLGKLPTVSAYSRDLLPELVATTTKWQWFSSFLLDYRSVMEAYGLLSDQRSEAFLKEPDGWLADIPVSIVVPDYYLTQSSTKQLPRETITEAMEAQKAAQRFSSDAKFKSVEDCSHWVMWDRPSLIVDEVADMIKRADERRKAEWGMQSRRGSSKSDQGGNS
mmetsp:Transcript_12986/g.39968  ORF Transcript_12986/g.39968 Transcript_12986/m.39968 type:complete len:391 (-) Transcript_12986:2018-3190(-)